MNIIKEKVSQAVTLLNEFGTDCWITFVRESQINGDPVLPFLVSADVTWHSAFIITSRGDTCAIVGLYDQKTIEETGAYHTVTGYVKDFKQPFLDYIQKLNPQTIAINFSVDSEVCDGITYGMYLTLYELLSEIGMQYRLISAEKIVSALRERKSEAEIITIQKAISITEQIFEGVTQFIKPGLTEIQIAEFMKNEVYMRKLGFAWEESVCPAVFTGPETAGAHYAPSAKIVEPGHILNMDFGVKVENYVSDMQRTFYILSDNETKAPPDVEKGFETIVTAIELSKQAIKPGIQGFEIDAIARNYIVSQGYSEFPHGLGHQVGRFSHDGTALLGPKWEKYAQKPFKYLEEGMVFTIEPRLTVEGKGTVTIEEMVLVTKSGCRFLSNPQKELILIK